MAPIRLEICKNIYIAKDQEVRGIRICNTDLGVVYSGDKYGGRVIFARQNNSPIKPITINKGEEPIIKDIACKSADGQNLIIKAKITAI